MEITVNSIYKPLFTTDKRYILLFGGRAGGRSHAASQKILLDTKHNKYSRIAVMRLILGDVRSSVWQEVKDRIEDFGMTEVTADQTMHYQFNGNSIDGKGFKKSSSQNTAKLKSLANYNTVWIEEADEITEEDFNNLDTSIRTKKGKNTIILSFNMPNKDHWIIKRWFNLVKAPINGYYIAKPKKQINDTEYIFATYENNKANLPETLIRTYENFKSINKEYYYTMIKGYVSEGLMGRVFNNWKPISNKEFNELPYYSSYGLDFGFANDPTALIEMKHHNNKIWVNELLYETGLLTRDISNALNRFNVKSQIVADSQDARLIQELSLLGHIIKGSDKGQGSIRAGINLLLNYEIFYTEDSINLAHELQNYVYQLDKNKNPTNEPIDDFNHLLDALRYVAGHELKKQKTEITWI